LVTRGEEASYRVGMSIDVDTEAMKNTSDVKDTIYNAHSMMSKKRFNEIVSMINGMIDDATKAEMIIENIKEIMRFDPLKKQYTPELGKQRRTRYHAKAKEDGTSIYVTAGIKHAYHAKREAKEQMNGVDPLRC